MTEMYDKGMDRCRDTENFEREQEPERDSRRERDSAMRASRGEG